MIDNTILMPQTRARRPRGRRLFLLLLLLLVIIVLGGRSAVSWYVDALWFGSLGYSPVFWKTLTLQWTVFAVFLAATFLVLYGWFRILMRLSRPDLRSASDLRDRHAHVPASG